MGSKGRRRSSLLVHEVLDEEECHDETFQANLRSLINHVKTLVINSCNHGDGCYGNVTL